MSYFQPFIDASGLKIPTYGDILDLLTSSAQGIYGQDIYLGSDSADYQMMSVFALAANDALQSLQLAYDSRSPATATGTGLDGVVKINGMVRKTASYSTVTLNLTGTPYAVINNCIASDVNGKKWALPASVALDASGNASVTATCQTLGAVTASAGTITTIATPTVGWLSVTNPTAAAPGQPVEQDSQVRSRQAISTQQPSQTLLAGTAGAIAALPGVTRYQIYENFTNTTDSYGNPPHSITAVVEGGADIDIAQTIYLNKGPGCNPNGTTSVVINDPVTNWSYSVGFDRLTYSQIYVSVAVHPLTGYTTATATEITNAIVSYLNGLGIGEEVTYSGLYAAIMAVNPNLSSPLFLIRTLYLGTSASPTATADLSIPFNMAAQTAAGNIVITTV